MYVQQAQARASEEYYSWQQHRRVCYCSVLGHPAQELLGHCLLLHHRFSASGVLTWLAWFSPRLQSRCQTGQGSQLEIKDGMGPFQVYLVILAKLMAIQFPWSAYQTA